LRVLFLRRQRFGGVATFTQLIAEALDKEGVEAVIDDADDWIPNQTGRAVDRDVSRKVLAARRGFDLVHAFGFRTAWACSAAFGGEPWVYTAHDMPKTVHRQLIERLNDARAGLCSSKAVAYALESAKAQRLQVVLPGLPVNRRVLDKSEARAMLGANDDTFLLAVAGRFCAEHSIDTAIYVADALPYFTRLIVSGEGELERHLRDVAKERVTITTAPFSQQTALAAADVAVVPSTVAGFSMSAIEAMLQGTPVALRRTGGLSEIAEDHQSGFYFETDEELLDLLNHLCFKRELLREAGRAARQRALSHFDISRTAGEYARAYRLALA
jgi:glycosyltransferase involved in cell wall biosynthesis